MRRQSITDGTWFDLSRATLWEEGCWFNGHNYISIATRSQWEHEALYCSRGGVWVVRKWSDWQGSAEAWTTISADGASAWLVRNKHRLPPRLERSAGASEV